MTSFTRFHCPRGHLFFLRTGVADGEKEAVCPRCQTIASYQGLRDIRLNFDEIPKLTDGKPSVTTNNRRNPVGYLEANCPYCEKPLAVYHVCHTKDCKVQGIPSVFKEEATK